jgi:hypothetical protein
MHLPVTGFLNSCKISAATGCLLLLPKQKLLK